MHTFAFFLRGSEFFGFTRDTLAAESLSDAGESSSESETGVFFGLYARSLSSSSESDSVAHIRLRFYASVAVKDKPRVRFAVALGGLVAIFAGSAFFLLRICERTVWAIAGKLTSTYLLIQSRSLHAWTPNPGYLRYRPLWRSEQHICRLNLVHISPARQEASSQHPGVEIHVPMTD